MRGRARLEVAPDRVRRLVRWIFSNFWTPVGAGVKTDEEVDALALYLFGDSQQGRDAARDIDRAVSIRTHSFNGRWYASGHIRNTRVGRPPHPLDVGSLDLHVNGKRAQVHSS